MFTMPASTLKIKESEKMSDRTQNENDALNFLDFIYGDMSEYSDGRFEVGTTSYSKTFELDEKREAIDFAFLQNTKGSLYLSPSLLVPETPQNGRANSSFFYATSVLWCDIDTWIKTPEDKQALKFLYDHCPPNRVVQTSSKPHMKLQLWWKLDEPCNDPEDIEEALLGVQQFLKGDQKVVRAYGLMRLAGSYSNPTPDKLANGSIIEPVQYFNIHDKKVNIEHFKKAYPITNFDPVSDSGGIQNHFEKTLSGNAFDIQEKIIDGREKYASNMIYAAIANLTGKLERWPTEQEVFDNVWPVYSTHVKERDGLTLEQANRGEHLIICKIKSKLKAFKSGRMASKGLADVDDIVFSYKENNKKKEDTKNEDKPNYGSASFNITDWSIKKKYQGEAKEIEWLIDGVMPLGVPMMLAAIGGIGKSYKTIEMGLRLASAVLKGSDGNVLGGRIVSHGNVAILSAEDSYDSIHRRLNSLDPTFERNKAEYDACIVPLSDVGGVKPFIKTTSNGIEVTEFFNDIKEQMKNIKDLKLIVIDPLQAFVEGDISSSNEFAQAVYSRCLVPLASELKATVLVIHHMKKEGSDNIKTASDARQAIRGVTALVDGGRGTYCLWNPSKETREALQMSLGTQYEESRFVQGAMVKFNDQHNSDITTYYREENGLLRDIGTINVDGKTSGLTQQQCEQALREIRMLWEAGTPLRIAPNSPNSIHKWLVKNFKINRDQAKIQVDNWTVRGLDNIVILEEREFLGPNRHKKNGIFVVSKK